MLAVAGVVLALVNSTALSAQPSRPATLGVLVGMNRSTLAGTDAASDLQKHTGLMLGVATVLPSKSRVSLEIDGLYTIKGFRSPGAASHFDLLFNYVEVPVLARIWLSNSPNGFHLDAGPAFAFRLTCSGILVSGIKMRMTCDDVEETNDTKVSRTDFGAVVGFGADLDGEVAILTLGARYNYGVKKVFDDSQSYNRVLSVYASVSRPRRK